MKLRAFAIGALLTCWVTPLFAASPNYPTQWYWIVGDTTPTTTVWNGATGAMVANTDATYQAWVAALPPDSSPISHGLATAITGSANNGSGLCRIAVVNSAFITASGNAKVVVKETGTTACDGTWTATVVDATHIDLTGSTFSGSSATGGIVGQGSPVATMAALLAFINSTNEASARPGKADASVSGGNLTLTNPLAYTINITSIDTSGRHLILPAENLFGSVPIGQYVNIINNDSNSNTISVYLSDTTTLIATIPVGLSAYITPNGNASANGSWTAFYLPNVLVGTATGQIPVIPIGTGALADASVTYGKIQNVSATNRFLGRITGGAGSAEELTAANGWSILGVIPAANEPAHTGDVTNSAGSLGLTIAAAAVSNSKLANMNANTFKCNNTGSGAVPIDCTVPQAQQILSQSQFIISNSVNFNSANTDTAFAITLPTGSTRYLINSVRISGASASLTTATYGLHTATGGGGVALIPDGSAITVNTASDAASVNTQGATPAVITMLVANEPTIYFRVGTAQGSAATGNVSLIIVPLPYLLKRDLDPASNDNTPAFMEQAA